MLLAVMMMVACLTAQAKENKTVANDSTNVKVEQLIDNKKVTAYYDIERLVIYNNYHKEIKVYDSNWKLVVVSNDSIDIALRGGTYYIVSDVKIIKKYV